MATNKNDVLEDLKKSFSATVNLYIKKENELKANAFAKGQLSKLSITQCHYIAAIGLLKNPTFSDLMRHFKVTNPTVSVIVNRLIKLGFVHKVQSDSDKRVYYLMLTETGKKIPEMEKKAADAFAELIREKLDSSEMKTFLSILNKISDTKTIV